MKISKLLKGLISTENNTNNNYINLPEGILSVSKGIICQQVNCSGGYGAGLSGAISKKYPIVEQQYRQVCMSNKPEHLLGTVLYVAVADDLFVANLFGQLKYGRSRNPMVVYTDYSALENCIQQVVSAFPEPIYVPEGIGCGLAGGDWNIVSDIISKYPSITIVQRPKHLN